MRLKRFSCWFVSLLWASFSPLASGHGYQLGDIKIIHPWAMPAAASVHGGAGGMGFMVLRNVGHQADKLLSASSASAKQIELHQFLKGAQPATRQTGSLEISGGADVRLEPGGSHLMLMGLEKPLTEGAHLPVTLQFERAGKIMVDMVVQLKDDEAIY